MSVFLSLGSNIEPIKENLLTALEYIKNIKEICIVNISSVYLTEPIGFIEQNMFLNFNVEINCSLKPTELLYKLQNIEKKMGRIKKKKWGPRNIDIDILLFDDLIMDTETLTIPHKELLNRNFFLKPLLEISEKIIYPVTNKLLIEIIDLKKINNQKLKRMDWKIKC